jgi:hypothetical protein
MRHSGCYLSLEVYLAANVWYFCIYGTKNTHKVNILILFLLTQG